VSKNPVHGFMLRMIPSVDPYVVHLARDPRGVVYSRLRNPRWLPFHPVKNALRWNIQNLVTELLLKREQGRYLRLRYEDFIDHPPETIRRILDFVQERSQLALIGDSGKGRGHASASRNAGSRHSGDPAPTPPGGPSRQSSDSHEPLGQCA
jgi:hypothetical protein